MNMINVVNTAARPVDDVWIPSSCSLCYGTCSILAHRVDGVVVKIEGNPESAVGKGRLCGKGVSGIMTHYDPNRLTRPLRRTNPKKGLDEDPKWKEISWDEALDEISAVLKKVRAEDPRKLVVQRTTTVTASRVPFQTFAAAFGTPNFSVSGGGQHCGNGAHLISGMMHASWSIVPDFEYCNYAVYFGASKGHSAGHASCSNMGKAADARARGMKMVVIDPICNFAAAKATEWVPLRVGTDAALALAMCNVLVNELGIYDGPYLQAKTNAPYLIGPDKLYVRHPESKQPLVWDSKNNVARPYTDVAAADMALEGEFSVDGIPCRPSFHCLRDHLRKFTPEWAEEISTIGAVTIRRLAKEFGTEARVGSTIVVDGVTLPYRPVAAIAFRGSQGHMNSVYNFYAVDLLNHLVGAADVVGSCLGFNPACHGHPDTGKLRYIPSAGPDGLMVTGMWMGYHYPYPPSEPRLPTNLGLQDLFVLGMTSPFLDSTDREEMWQRFDLPYRPEVMVNFGANLIMSIANKETVAASLAKYKFMVSFDLFLTETSNFADIVLPDCSYLQSLDSRSNFPFIFSLPAGTGEWCWPIRQPLLPPDGEQRNCADVLLEIADRVGFRADLNAAYNASLNIQAPHRLEGETQYSYAQICDAELKNNFGDERGLDWFKEQGLIKWKKKPAGSLLAPVRRRARAHLLGIHAADRRKDRCDRRAARSQDSDGILRTVTGFPAVHVALLSQTGFRLLYAFYYRDIVHTNSFTMENPWLDEAARLDPFSYTIAINATEARKKSLHDGQLVWVENEGGRKVKGRLKLTEAIHPEGIGIAAMCGHWSDGMPIAKGKGVFFNELLELDWAHVSPVNNNLDLCAKVRIVPVEATS